MSALLFPDSRADPLNLTALLYHRQSCCIATQYFDSPYCISLTVLLYHTLFSFTCTHTRCIQISIVARTSTILKPSLAPLGTAVSSVDAFSLLSHKFDFRSLQCSLVGTQSNTTQAGSALRVLEHVAESYTSCLPLNCVLSLFYSFISHLNDHILHFNMSYPTTSTCINPECIRDCRHFNLDWSHSFNHS